MIVTKKVSCGVDLGGTKIAAGLVDEQGTILVQETIPTEASRGFDTVMTRTAQLIRRLASNPEAGGSELRSVGVGAAGQIELTTGAITASPNLGWENVPFRRVLEEKTGVPVQVDNDVRVATLGEYLHGHAVRPASLYNVFVGTGVGSGYIDHDVLLRGASNSACEIGHMKVALDGAPCNCGGHGCLEAYCGGLGLARMAREAVREGRAEALGRRVEGRLETLDGRVVSEAARAGDRAAIDLLSAGGAYLGLGIANIVNLFNPEVVVVGGGMIALGEPFLEPAWESLRRRAIPGALEKTRIEISRMGVRGAILGAANLWRVDAAGRIG